MSFNSAPIIKVDGQLNENEWLSANTYKDFLSIEPTIGVKVNESPIIYLLQTKSFLYVGVYCPFDSLKKPFVATLERDKPQDDDDYVEIQLDTYNDKTNALCFRVNAAAARYDYENNLNGQSRNGSWNTFWNAASYHGKTFWSTEFKIPYTSLRFNSKENVVMGVKAIVHNKYRNEKLMFPLITSAVNPISNHMANMHEVKLNQIQSKNAFYFTPYVKCDYLELSKRNSNNEYYTETQVPIRKHFVKHSDADNILSNLGCDIKYRIKNKTALDVTLNPDFAQVEADQLIVNLSRFPVFLPEKRPFFLENADLFNSDGWDHRLFQSRTIGLENGQAVPLYGGVRLNGNINKFSYGILNMQSRGIDASNIEAANYSVYRAKQRFGKKGSFIGAINTSKIFEGDKGYHSVSALDGEWWLNSIVRLSYFVAQNFEDNNKNALNPAWGINLLAFKQKGFVTNIRYREYPVDFNVSAMGFLSVPNTREAVVNTGYRWQFKPKGNGVTFFQIGNYLKNSWTHVDGKQNYFQENLYINTVFKKGYRVDILPLYERDNLSFNWAISNSITIPTGKYEMKQFEMGISSGFAFRYNWDVTIIVGEFYGGKQLSAAGSYKYSFSKYLNTELEVNYNQVEFSESYITVGTSPYYYRTVLSAKIGLAINTKLTFNIYNQYDAVNKKLGINARLRYNPIEGTDLYLVFNHNAITNGRELKPSAPWVDNQLVSLKFSYTFMRR
ncbi:MAG: carbohydrate binding family 9 domain-containing protein [Bacteroidia bacterium]|nr:carbohydrate binding family 9 domain-containing protein [Bacteroidia bacterium]